eukprot:2489449-Prymnesium_polylepis.1
MPWRSSKASRCVSLTAPWSAVSSPVLNGRAAGDSGGFCEVESSWASPSETHDVEVKRRCAAGAAARIAVLL